MKSDNKKQVSRLKRLLLSSLFGRKIDTLVLNAQTPTTAIFTTMHPDTIATTRPGTDEFMHIVTYKSFNPVEELNKYIDLSKLGDGAYVISLKLLYSMLSAVKFDKQDFMDNVYYDEYKNMYYRIATKKIKGENTEVIESIISSTSTALFSITKDIIDTVIAWVDNTTEHKVVELQKDQVKPNIFFIDLKEELGFRIPVTHGTTILSYEYFGKKKGTVLNAHIGIDYPVARVVYRYDDDDVFIESVYPADVKYIRRS